MRYLLTFHMQLDQLPDAEKNDKCFSEMMEFIDRLKRNHSLVYDSQVLPEPEPIRFPGEMESDTASERLGGFFIIDVGSHAEAVELARECPHNQVGAVELHALNETNENAYQPDA